MGKIFIDTSALFALINLVDEENLAARTTWKDLLQRSNELLTNNYIIVECLSLVQRRLGLEHVRKLQAEIFPLITVDWIYEEQHALAVQYAMKSNRRKLTLVDCSAFETMRRLGIETAFTFDSHFRAEGFNTIP
jgi:predicted nucleic acid-binding protein